MSSVPSHLAYSISEKNEYLVVSFEGSMTRLTAEVLERCVEDVIKRSAKRVVLNFQAIQQIGPGAVPALVRIQKCIRDRRGGGVRLCSMRNEVRKFLVDAGAARIQETRATLMEALGDLASYGANETAA